MNCKYCQQLLEEGSTICPHCGKDNAEMAEENLPQEMETAGAETVAAPEMKKGITLTTGKLTAVIVGVILLTTLVVALILQGAGFLQPSVAETVPADIPTESAATTAPVATIPADGNPDDVTCKGSYTVSDEDVIAAMETVVATCGDAQLTNGELQVYYWMQVQQFLQNYGSYAAYFGLDYTQPLDTQVCGLVDSGITWQQFFLSQALDAWHNYQALANEAIANNIPISQENQDYLDGMEDALVTESGLQGFDSPESYLAYHVGPGASVSDYKNYMNVYYQGYEYFEEKYDGLLPTDAEIEAYFDENAAEYEEQGVTKDTVTVDVRHILVLPEGATVDTIYTDTFSDDAWAEGEKNANDILAQWQAGEKTEDSFAALANEKSQDPGSNTNGGLYTGVEAGDMVEEFDAWCFDKNRKAGDYDIVKTALGYHIMYFSGSTPVWSSYAEEDLITERSSAMVEEIMDRHPVTINYKAIQLGFVDMSQ